MCINLELFTHTGQLLTKRGTLLRLCWTFQPRDMDSNNVITTPCSATLIRWPRYCSNRSISHAHRAHSSKPAAAGLLLWSCRFGAVELQVFFCCGHLLGRTCYADSANNLFYNLNMFCWPMPCRLSLDARGDRGVANQRILYQRDRKIFVNLTRNLGSSVYIAPIAMVACLTHSENTLYVFDRQKFAGRWPGRSNRLHASTHATNYSRWLCYYYK